MNWKRLLGTLASLALMASSLSGCGEDTALDGRGSQLSVTVTGTGTVRIRPAGLDCGAGAICEVVMVDGTEVTLTATPGSGQKFGGWGGACSNNTSDTCILVMNRALTVNATFVALQTTGWTEGLTLSADGASKPVLSIDKAGRGLAAWRQLDAATGQNHVWVSRSSGASTWGAPERLDGDNGNVADVRLAVDPTSGRAMLVWVQQGARVDLWARSFDPQAGWGTMTRVDAADGMVGDARVGVDGLGNSVAVWSQIGPSTRWSVYASRHRPAAGWSAPVLLEDNEVIGSQDSSPLIAVAPSGEALVAWNRANGASSSIWGSRLAATGAWSVATELVADAGAQQSIGAYDVAVDRNGNGMLVWGQLDLVNGIGQSTVRFKRYSAGAWQTSASLAAIVVGSNYLPAPVLSFNASGAAQVSWTLADGTLLSAAAPSGGNFGPSAVLRLASSSSVLALPAQGVDGAGHASVSWTDYSTRNAVIRSRSTAGDWSAPLAMNATAGTVWGDTALVNNDAGDIILAWQQLKPGEGTRVAVRRYFSGN